MAATSTIGAAFAQPFSLASTFLEALLMKFENYEQFKSYAKTLQSALNRKMATPSQDNPVKLSVVQEALAQSVGYDCLAAFKATAFKVNEQIVKEVPDGLGSFLMCVEGLVYDDEMEPQSFVILDQEYATIEDIRRARNFTVHREKRSEGYIVDRHPELNAELWSQCYVKAIHIECPSIGEYGVPYYGDEHSAAERITQQFQMKVVERPDVYIHDRGDDGGTTVFFEVWAPQSVFNTLEDLPLVDHDGDEV